MTEEERFVDTLMYLTTISLSAFRFSKGLPPFDFDTSTVEYMASKTMPFILDQDCNYQEAHRSFVADMLQAGWRRGPEDFVNRTHPDLIHWDELSTDVKSLYAYLAALICSAKDFYHSLKADLEVDFIDDLQSLAIKGKIIIPSFIHAQNISH